MTRKTLVPGLLALACLTLAGCGGGGAKMQIPMPTPQLRLEDQFGMAFGAAFRATPSGEPTEPQATDIEAVNLTAEPREAP